MSTHTFMHVHTQMFMHLSTKRIGTPVYTRVYMRSRPPLHEGLYIGSISALPTARPLRGYGRVGTQNDRLRDIEPVHCPVMQSRPAVASAWSSSNNSSRPAHCAMGDDYLGVSTTRASEPHEGLVIAARGSRLLEIHNYLRVDSA